MDWTRPRITITAVVTEGNQYEVWLDPIDVVNHLRDVPQKGAIAQLTDADGKVVAHVEAVAGKASESVSRAAVALGVAIATGDFVTVEMVQYFEDEIEAHEIEMAKP